jgi:adenylate kinase
VALNEMMESQGHKVDAVIGLEVPEDELVVRLLKRGEQSGRADDNLETIKKRLDVYHSQTLPLKDFYKKQGIYCSINGTGDMEEIFGTIVESIEGVKRG